MPKAVTLLSGGMDSATLLYYLLNKGYAVHGLSFDYGQRHRKELKAAGELVQDVKASVTLDIVMIGAITKETQEGTVEPISHVLKGSSLTDPSVPVPEGHYADESMKATVVPNRNAIMLSIAYGVAVAEKAELVTFAAHAGDHTIYPDCRPDFVEALGGALALGNTWDDDIANPPTLEGPFLTYTKSDIVEIGTRLGVPFELTWSCYKGGELHCGKCGTCVERKEAFQLVGVDDPTEYEAD